MLSTEEIRQMLKETPVLTAEDKKQEQEKVEQKEIEQKEAK